MKTRTANRVPQWTRKQAAEFGHRLREAREAASLSQRELSFPGCTAAYISRVEKGDRYPSVVLMRGLAKRLGCSPEWLETGQEIGMVDALLGQLTEVTADGLSCISFRKEPEPVVEVNFEYEGLTRTACGESLRDALFGAVTWAANVERLREARSAVDAETAEMEAEIERVLAAPTVTA